MWPQRESGFLLAALLAGSGCEAPAPPPVHQAPTRLVGRECALRFEAQGGSGCLRLEHHLGGVLAELHYVRLVVGPDRRTTLLGLQSAERQGDGMVLTCASHPDHDVEVHLRLGDEGRIAVQVTDVVGLRSDVCELTLDYLLPEFADPDEAWLPHQHPEPGQVAGDGSFHSPVAFLRRGTRALALLPDIAELARKRRIPQALELDMVPGEVPGEVPRLRHGLVAHVPAEEPGGGFLRSGPIATQGESLSFGHTLRLFHAADRSTGDRIFRELWETCRVPPKTNATSFDAASREFFTRAAGAGWQDLSHGRGVHGIFRAGLASRTDGLEGADAWYSMRQQSLRTAYGALLFGRRTGRPELIDKARQSLEHVLTAPNRGGLLPSLFVGDPDSGRRSWILDSAAAGDPDHYHSLDVATTCTWMLLLGEEFPQHRDNVLAVCRRTARFFRRNQLPSGAFPSFFEKQFLAPVGGPLGEWSAETGSVARFLIEFARIAGDTEAMDAARRALEAIERMVDDGRWLDVESAAPASPLVDPRSGVPRQGTLGLIHCAMAAARFGAREPAPRWHRLTERLLGQLARYQQVWAPPWIAGAQIGGFGAGNFDHRWNDARQGLAALAFYSGYELTGDSQWLERGVAALDAGLSCRGREHQPPGDRIGPETSLHWGPGTACTVAEMVRERLGSAVIDMRRGTGHGIDALWIEDYALAESRVHFQVLTRARDLETARVRFAYVPERVGGLTLVVNEVEIGTFSRDELRAGVEVHPAYMPSFTFAPPAELCQWVPFAPRALARDLPADCQPRVEVQFGEEPPELYELTDRGDGVLSTADAYAHHRALPIGAEVRSRLSYRVGGRTYTEPRQGFRISRVSDSQRIDPGEDDGLELGAERHSRIRRFVDGTESGRHAPGTGFFTYRAPVRSRAEKVEFTVRAAGRLRVRVGDLLLHEDDRDQAADRPRDIELVLADHRLWASGDIPLTFEAVGKNDEVDVAWIRYTSSGDLADLNGVGPTHTDRRPERELHVVVQPLTLLDSALDVDLEALRLAFFGGTEYEVTPQPNSQRTSGSVARFIDAASGGRTVLRGAVLPVRRWNLVAADGDRPDAEMPAAFLQHVRTTHEDADVVVAILGHQPERPLPKPRHIDVGGRRVPLVFLPARGADGSFLSCGTAAAAILAARYGTSSMRSATAGNFGALALSGSDSHLPPIPCGLNLARTGWSDHVLLKHADQHDLAISPLATGRVGFVLDCSALPGRGRLFLECRAVGDAGPGALLYWSFDKERPYLRDLTGEGCSPSVMRLSPVRPRTATPFVPGDQEDLFRAAATRLPAQTMTGEELWRILAFRMLGNGQATFHVRYLAEDLLDAAHSRWTHIDTGRHPIDPGAGEPARVNARVVASSGARGSTTKAECRIEQRNGESWVTLPPGRAARVRLQSNSATYGLHRLFGRMRGIHGRAIVTLGTGEATLVSTTFAGVTEPRWLQADLPTGTAPWLEVQNTGDTSARLVLSDWIRVPRVRPVHRIRPPRLDETRNPRLSDGVVYDRALRLPAPESGTGHNRTPVVLPAGPVAIRIRAGTTHGTPPAASARLSAVLTNSDGSQRTEILRDAEIRGGDQDGLFLAVASVPAGETDRVAFLSLSWTGTADIQVVDLTVIRPE